MGSAGFLVRASRRSMKKSVRPPPAARQPSQRPSAVWITPASPPAPSRGTCDSWHHLINRHPLELYWHVCTSLCWQKLNTVQGLCLQGYSRKSLVKRSPAMQLSTSLMVQEHLPESQHACFSSARSHSLRHARQGIWPLDEAAPAVLQPTPQCPAAHHIRGLPRAPVASASRRRLRSHRCEWSTRVRRGACAQTQPAIEDQGAETRLAKSTRYSPVQHSRRGDMPHVSGRVWHTPTAGWRGAPASAEAAGSDAHPVGAGCQAAPGRAASAQCSTAPSRSPSGKACASMTRLCIVIPTWRGRCCCIQGKAPAKSSQAPSDGNKFVWVDLCKSLNA